MSEPAAEAPPVAEVPDAVADAPEPEPVDELADLPSPFEDDDKPVAEEEPEEEVEPQEDPVAEPKMATEAMEASDFFEAESADRMLKLKIDGEVVERSVAEWVREGQKNAGADSRFQKMSIREKELTAKEATFEEYRTNVVDTFQRLGASSENFRDEITSWGPQWAELLQRTADLVVSERVTEQGGSPHEKALLEANRINRRLQKQMDSLERKEKARERNAEEAKTLEAKREKENQEKVAQQRAALADQLEHLLGEALGPVDRRQWKEAWSKLLEKSGEKSQELGRNLKDEDFEAIAAQVAKDLGVSPKKGSKTDPDSGDGAPPPPLKRSAPGKSKKRSRPRKAKTQAQFFKEMEDWAGEPPGDPFA